MEDDDATSNNKDNGGNVNQYCETNYKNNDDMDKYYWEDDVNNDIDNRNNSLCIIHHSLHLSYLLLPPLPPVLVLHLHLQFYQQ